jgi:DnaJ-class molecular chaperone
MTPRNLRVQRTCASCGGNGTVQTPITTPSGTVQTLTETCLDCL